MRVLVTSPSGGIGSLLVPSLRLRGHQVVTVDERIVDRHPTRPRPAGERSTPSSWGKLDNVLRRVRPEAVVHLAPPGLEAALFDDVLGAVSHYDGEQVARTAQLLDAAAIHGVRRFVLESSWTVYGKPQVSPIDERALAHPTTLAAETILACERLTVAHARSTGTGYAVLRCFTPSGSDEQPSSEWSRCGEGLLGRAAWAALTGHPLKIYGTGFPTTDGTALRDYVHIADVVRAYVAALEQGVGHGDVSGVWNVGSGKPTSDLDVVREVEHLTGRPITVTTCPCPSSVPAVGVADPASIAMALAWKPQHTFSDIVRSVVEHSAVRLGTSRKSTSWTSS